MMWICGFDVFYLRAFVNVLGHELGSKDNARAAVVVCMLFDWVLHTTKEYYRT